VLFHYQERTEGVTFDHAAPLLTYSRPKGCYPAGERILLDFYLTHAGELAAGANRVHYSIDGDVEGDLTAWTPYYIENLGEGEHTLELRLVDGDGAVIPGRFNESTHGFRVGGCEGS
jgi:hypothetical protein